MRPILPSPPTLRAPAIGRPAFLLSLLGLLAGTTACGEDDTPRVENVTWAEHVAEIVHTNCAACHNPDGPGPMPLLTYDDVAPMAELVAQMTGVRRMPPWLPHRDLPAFRDERGLTDTQIAMLRSWADDGAPRGDASTEPDPPVLPSGWQLGEPDLVLELDGVYQVPATHHHDIYRNFVLHIPLDEPRWVKAVELLPDNPAVVHHATMQVDPTPSSRLVDETDPEPGYDDRVFASAARPPGGFFLAWTPGLVPSPYPDGMAWQAEPGSDFVVQLHLWPTGQPETLDFRVGLHFTDEPPTRIPTILRLGGQEIDIAPGETDYTIEDTLETPVDIEVMGVYPHAHFLGKQIHAWGETPAGDSIPLMTIEEWDFNWQDAYYYEEPIRLPAGTTLRKRWTFDNSADNPQNPHSPPERVVWGLNSTDEMAEFWLQVVTDSEEELEELERAARQSDSRKQVEGWEFLVQLDSTDADAQEGLASLALALGEYDEALYRYQIALESEPRLVSAHMGLARLHEETGNLDLALDALRNALELIPNNPTALTDMGRLRAQRGELAQARAHLEEALAVDPRYRDALNNLGSVLRETGSLEEAADLFEEAIRLHPDFPEAYFNLSLTLAQLGDVDGALELLDYGLERDPDNLQPVVSLTWLLATDPDPQVRQPEIATELALQLYDVVGPDPVISDLLATSLAAEGAFIDAVQFIVEAIEVAEQMGLPESRIAELEARHTLFRRGEAFVRP